MYTDATLVASVMDIMHSAEREGLLQGDFYAVGTAFALSCPPEETQPLSWPQWDSAEMARSCTWPLTNFVPPLHIFLLVLFVFSAILLVM